MVEGVITTICVTISIIVYHIGAQDYQAPPWADSNGGGFDQQTPSPSYPESLVRSGDTGQSSPDFPQYSDPQYSNPQYPNPQSGTPSDSPSYSAYSYDDPGPGLERQGTSTATICFCAPAGTCINGTVNLGEGQIDIRVGGTVCIDYYHYDVIHFNDNVCYKIRRHLKWHQTHNNVQL